MGKGNVSNAGKNARSENSSGTPYLVRGAKLRCDCGSHSRKLNLPICHGAYAGGNPLMHDMDCTVGENIATFGICSSPTNPNGQEVTLVAENGEIVTGRPCTPIIVGKWMNAHPHQKIAKNSGAAKNISPNARTYYSALTTDSFLVCSYKGLIEPETSGQENG